MTDLSICQVCKKEPATYGDGVTWSRCGGCELEYRKENNISEQSNQAPTEENKTGKPHVIVEGLTSIIMPVYINNYTLFHYTGNAIGAIREHTDRQAEQYELLIIDNGSPIKPPNLQSYYADKVIVNEKNEGVTKAWNKGIRISSGEYIVLINNDTQVFDGWINKMKKGLNKYDLVMAHPMYSNTEPFARATEAIAVGKGEKKFDPIPGGKDFSCVMFKRSLVEEIGLFDEDFFNYASDSEFFDRMDKFGKTYKILDNVAIHHVSDATGFSIPETPEIMNKDKETYEKKKKENVEVKPKVEMPQKPSNLARTQATGDKIFLLKDQKYHWIRKPEVLQALGFNFGQENTLNREEFNKYERGEDITMENVNNFKEKNE